MAKRYDLVIVGAGPGEAMAAKIEIFEKKEFDLVLISGNGKNKILCILTFSLNLRHLL
jgi:hypothetical protein